MEPAAERFTHPSLDGVHLHALHWGDPDAPDLVLLHGAGANAWWWSHLAPVLAAHFHVVALDFRGHGDSDYPEERIPGAFTRDLEALLAHLGAPDAALVGHSLGAHVALDHAAGGGRPRRLVLLDPSRGATPRRRRATRLALSLHPSYATREEAVHRFRFLPGASAATETLRRAIAERSVREEPDGRFSFKFDERWFGIPSTGPPELARVACPTLVMRGGESPLLTEHGAEELVASLPDARLSVLEGAGHHVLIDRPERCLEELVGFLPLV